MPIFLYYHGPLSTDLSGQLAFYQAIIQPAIAATFLSGTVFRSNLQYFGNRRRSRHYHLRLKARNRPIERPFRDPVRQYTLPSTWKWKRRTPMQPRYGLERFFWMAVEDGPYFWKAESCTYSAPEPPLSTWQKRMGHHNNPWSQPTPVFGDDPFMRPTPVGINDSITIPPRKPPYCATTLVNTVNITYCVSAHASRKRHGSLIDRGANGGVAGDDVRIIEQSPHRKVDIQGLDNHQVNSVPIVTAGGVMQTQHGDVIAVLHQYAYHGRGKTIHSSGQLEWYKNDVNDRSIKVGGLQRLQTIDGYTIPINICDGLAYANLRPYTDTEWNTLPHIILTGDVDWDPCVLDHQMDDDVNWFDAVSALERNPNAVLFDEFGDYRREVGETEIFYDSQHSRDINDIIDDCVSSPTGFY